MKRLWNLAAFTLLACAGLAAPTQAGGSFGLFYCGRHCNQCAVCIRPYNAFTPVLCGDVTGYGGCGQGCGQGGYGPIGCPCGYGCGQGGCGQGCGQGGCGQGGCGQGGCGQGGCGYKGCCFVGCGHQYGWNPAHGMANVNPLAATAYTGALGYDPPDGYGNGAFGTYGLGRLSVFGNPGCGGGCCAGGACQNMYGPMNNYNPPMACGPNGCAPNYGFGMDFAAPTFPTSAEAKPALLQVPTTPRPKELAPVQTNYVYPMQPVSYTPGQQMTPYGYTQPAWGYYGYQTPYYPAWGYQGW